MLSTTKAISSTGGSVSGSLGDVSPKRKLYWAKAGGGPLGPPPTRTQSSKHQKRPERGKEPKKEGGGPRAQETQHKPHYIPTR